MPMRPIVVCICGSTKFKTQILGHTQRETIFGKIAINHGFFHHTDKFPITDEQKDMLDELMLRKIDIADEILVVEPGEYIGNSTKRAITYAQKQGKRVRYASKEEAERKRKHEERKAQNA